MEEKDLSLRVCEHCLMAIESHEGNQLTRHLYIDDDAPEDESRCDWCGEINNTELYELV